jgi:Mlc titration factor MtfA (ptsG expression regulator)
MLAWYKLIRRRRIVARPFPAEWEAVLAQNVGHYGRLTASEQLRLRDATQVLVLEKVWEGVKRYHSKLYELLAEFYGVQPIHWIEEPDG